MQTGQIDRVNHHHRRHRHNYIPLLLDKVFIERTNMMHVFTNFFDTGLIKLWK